MTADRWIKLGDVVAAWQQAGLPGSLDTIRRMMDDGTFGEVHRTRGRFRTVRESAVQRAIREELGEEPPQA